ncbi:hypothetical protein SynBOUM118_01042 [Synechococcus sp. BOUM118]|nr:hypothetical protein SynBOUM118_01042 [Synechococcus sp. BOUM118]
MSQKLHSRKKTKQSNINTRQKTAQNPWNNRPATTIERAINSK